MSAVQARLERSELPGPDIMLFLGGACVFRVLFWLAMGRVIDSADAIHYIEAARHLAQGDLWGIDPKIPLLYPLFGAVLSLFARDLELACRLVSLIASGLLVIPVYVLARDLHGRASARVAALIVVIWPWLADYGSRVSTEALACTLWFLAIWLLVRALRRGGAWPAIAALAFFALHLARPEGVVIFLAAFPAAAILCVRDERAKASRLIPFALVGCALLVLYVLFMYRLTGAPTLSYRAGFLVEDLEVSSQQRAVTGTVLLFVKTSADTLFNVLPIMLGPVLLVFLGVGLFHSSERGRDVRLELCMLLFAGVQWATSLTVLSPAPRYLMATLVALSLWSARGMVIVTRQAANLRWGRVLRPLPVTALVMTMAFGTAVTLASEHLGRRPRQPREYKVAGHWMKANLEPGLILTRKPQVGYYANMPTTGPALDDTVETAVARAREVGARYVVVDERYTAQIIPPLEALLDPAQAPPDLRPLHELVPDYPEARVLIYEVAGPSTEAP